MTLAFPVEMTALPNWFLWRYKAMPGGKMTKVPVQINGAPASTTDPATWTTFEKVRCFDKIGFVFTKESNIVGIDLDHVIQGETLFRWSECVIEDSNSFTEYSPSRQGVHIIGFGEKPCWLKSRYDLNSAGIEVYNSGRYFTMTGEVFRNYSIMREINLEKVFEFLKPNEIRREESKKPGHSRDQIQVSVHDVISGFKEEENCAHPFHDSSTGSNFRVDRGGESWRCWRHGVTGNALHLLGQKEGIISCGDKPSKEQWTQIFKNAEEEGLIPARKQVDPVMRREAYPI